MFPVFAPGFESQKLGLNRRRGLLQRARLCSGPEWRLEFGRVVRLAMHRSPWVRVLQGCGCLRPVHQHDSERCFFLWSGRAAHLRRVSVGVRGRAHAGGRCLPSGREQHRPHHRGGRRHHLDGNSSPSLTPDGVGPSGGISQLVSVISCYPSIGISRILLSKRQDWTFHGAEEAGRPHGGL